VTQKFAPIGSKRHLAQLPSVFRKLILTFRRVPWITAF